MGKKKNKDYGEELEFEGEDEFEWIKKTKKREEKNLRKMRKEKEKF